MDPNIDRILEIDASSAPATGIVKCPKCGARNNPGVVRCAKCNTSLRPTLLAVVTLLGPIVLLLQSLALLAGFERNPIAPVSLLINAAGIVILISLRFGRYWAWVALQVIWAINIAVTVIVAFAVNPAFLVVAGAQTLIIVLLWIYIHSERVKSFCSVGRTGGLRIETANERSTADLGTEAPRASTDDSDGLTIETVNEASTSFVAQRAVAQILGKTRQGKCVVFMFKGESAARQADARRANRVGGPRPTGLRAFTDGMVALEYPFSDQSTEAQVLDFCMLFENSGVQLGVVDGCSPDTQRRILSILGMKQGLGVG